MNIDSKDLVSLRELQLLAMEKGLLVAVGIKDSVWQFDAADDGEIGYEVVKLKRERYAFLTLDGLKSGEYRKLSVKEVKKLYSLK